MNRYIEFVNEEDSVIDEWVRDKKILHMAATHYEVNYDPGYTNETSGFRIISFIYEIEDEETGN